MPIQSGHKQSKPGEQIRRAYDCLIELGAGGNTSACQLLGELRDLYIRAFQNYNRGEIYAAESLARAVQHLAKAAWYDAKIKFLESHAEDLPHLLGLNEDDQRSISRQFGEVEKKLEALEYSSNVDRFSIRARNHINLARGLPTCESLLGATFLRAAYEYVSAAELLLHIEVPEIAAA